MADKRDWQADMELAYKARYGYKIEHLNPILDALFYWLQYAEKWRVPYKVTCELLERQQERTNKAEAREQKLIDALARVKRHTKGSGAYTPAAFAHYEAHKVLMELYTDTKEAFGNLGGGDYHESKGTNILGMDKKGS